MVELHIADDVPQRRCGKVFNRRNRALHAVGIQLRVGDLEIDDRVDLHRDVVLGDHGLRREIDDLLLERNLLRDAVDERHLEMHAGAPGRVVSAEALHDVGVCLRHNFDAGDQQSDHHDCKHHKRDHTKSEIHYKIIHKTYFLSPLSLCNYILTVQASR